MLDCSFYGRYSGYKLCKSNVPLHAPGKNTKKDLSCSENVAYDTVGSTVKTSTPANMPCSKNVAYATVNKTEDNRQSIRIEPKQATVYEEAEVYIDATLLRISTTNVLLRSMV